MVGSLQTGTMKDNDNEGHLGWLIQQVADSALPNIISSQPNLVLINVGTNNAAQNNGVSTASELYIQLLDNLWAAIPGATVILSTLLPNKNADTNALVNSMNEQMRTTVMQHYSGLNRNLALADMDDGFITQSDLNDDTHPLDSGYKKMASVWWSAFQEVERYGWLTAPPDTGIADNLTAMTQYTCPKNQRGSGIDDGPYVHSSADQGNVWKAPFGILRGDADYGNNFFFAQLVNFGGIRGAEVDEIVSASISGDTWSCQFWVNYNNNDFGEAQSFDPGYSCAPNASRFADLNNDGLDDFICVDGNGNLLASLNRGGNPPVFEPAGFIGNAPAFWADGYTVDLVHIADIDGDGRADWCILVELGSVSCLRNGGQGVLPTAAYGGFWQGFSGPEGWTVVFPGQGRGNAAGVNLVDLNGDFKADWLFMNQAGQVDTFINNCGTGDGMIPDWQYVNITHTGPSSFGVTNTNSAVKFGRMYGTGRRDYIWIQSVAESPTSASIQIHIWKNLGSGGTYLKGDGTTYCDMDDDGKDDYVWVGPDGLIDIYLNDNNAPYWVNYGAVITLGGARKTIHVADLNGDGKCDLLSVDRTSGAVHMWLNNWSPSTKTWSFADKGIISGGVSCTQGYGVIENDLGVRFADLTGDGKADYLCIERNGRVTGYLSRGMSSSGQITFEDVGQIKLATNYDRQNIRFNDVNGDGRADLLWIDKYTGDTSVQYNGGEIPSSGSHFFWDTRAVRYKGWDRGSNMHFGALGGQHRADIIQVIPRTNVAYVSYNKCASGSSSGGDDPNMGDPGLPPYSGGETCIDSDDDGSCEIDIGPNAELSLPPDTYLPLFQPPGSYNEGDGFLFDTPLLSDLNINLILASGPTQWEDIDCGSISAINANGDTLGCIALGVTWVAYSIYLDGGPIATTPTRSLTHSNHHFQVHSDWEPVENCTTKCKLLGSTPQHTWTLVGNGTSHGIYHELHFMHTDSFTAHRAYQGSSPGDSTIAPRQYRYKTNQLDSHLRPIYIDVFSRNSERNTYKESFDEYSSPVELADSVGVAVERSVAMSEVAVYCWAMLNGGSVGSSNVLSISQLGSDEMPTMELEQDLNNCENDMSEPDKHLGSVVLVCGRNLTLIDPSLGDDPDGDLSPDIWTRSLHKRAGSGSSKNYKIRNMLDLDGISLNFTSAPYPNGDNGNNLQRAGGDTHVYALRYPGDCTDATIADDAPIDGDYRVIVQSEHIIERVTAPSFFEFIQDPQLDLQDGNGLTRAPANLQAIPFNVIRDYMAVPYSTWTGWQITDPDADLERSVFTEFALTLGSTTEPGVMTNLVGDLNNVKSRVWNTASAATAIEVWNGLANTPTTQNTESALDLMRAGIAIFNYINDANVQIFLGRIHNGLHTRLNYFDRNFAALVVPSQEPTNLEGLWVTFINFWAQRMVNSYRNYANNRLDILAAPWRRILAGNYPQAMRDVASENLESIDEVAGQIPNLVF